MGSFYLGPLVRIAREVYPAPTWTGARQRAVFILRQLAHYPHARRWLDYLDRPWMSAVVAENPSLYRKVIRPYISRNWPDDMKVSAMIHHYDQLNRQTTPEVFSGIFSPSGADLADFPARNGDHLTIRLRYDSQFRKEGETTLELLSTKHQCRVFCLTFVLAADCHHRSCLIIGAVYGLDTGTDKNIIKEVAKSLFGLRPKALLLLVLQELARAWGAHGLLGVGSRIHTSRHQVYALNRSRQFAIAYDEFWHEAGGVRLSDGFFRLPLRFVERSLTTIESHKRSLYRQRYAWISELQVGQRRRLVEWAPAVPPDQPPAPPSAKAPVASLLAPILLSIISLLFGHTGLLGAEPEDWSLHGQTTAIEQWHGGFTAPYTGPNSLQPAREDKHTATMTLFLGRRLWPSGGIYYNPEVTQGNGLSSTVGVAGFPNGEATRAGSQTPEYNTARLFLRQTFSLGGAPEVIHPDNNQLAGAPAARRLTLTLGKLSAADLFDNNTYSHDPRSQLLNWALMEDGAWDYPSDTKGYTGGCIVDLKLAARSLRWGIFLEPAEANGRPLDSHWAAAHGQVFEWEERYAVDAGQGVVRAMVFWNRAHMGSYAETLQSAGTARPDVTLTRRYRSKAGAGLNWEQPVAAGLGVFARAGFNDGRNETWAFTEIDRTASIGLSLKGTAWRRPDDTLALAAVVNGLSATHRRYLEAGGYGFIVGDGALNYGTEGIVEIIYDWKPVRWLALAADLQFISNPGYNRDRGPVAILTTRLHAAF